MKNLLFLFLFLASQSFAQRTIASKDIADVVLPNPEVELFYGNANYSADHIVVLPEHIVIYNAEEVTFHLLDKKSKLNLFDLCLFDIDKIVTSRVRYFGDVNGKSRLVSIQKTPLVQHSYMNDMKMYSLSDTSVYAGLIRIKKDLKIAVLFVENDSLKLELETFDINKSFSKVSKQDKRKKIRLKKYDTKSYSAYVELGDKQIFSYKGSPYRYKKWIIYKKNNTRYIRDSTINFNSLFYKTKSNDSLKLFYQNSFEDISEVVPFRKNTGFMFWPKLLTSRNRLILWQGSVLDSLIVFDKNLKQQASFQLIKEIRKALPDSVLFSEKSFWVGLYKDEFTEKIYVELHLKQHTRSIISELNIDEKNKKLSFRYLRTIQFKGAWIYPLTINKGILYMGTENALIGNKYVYKYDLYDGLKNKDKVLEIAFKQVEDPNKKYNTDAWALKYEKFKPLTKKVRKKYFKGLDHDTSYFKQSTHIEVLQSFKKAIEHDSVNYALSYLLLYNGVDRLEIEDDIKAKNLLFFDLMVEYYSKEEAVAQTDYLIKEFASFETEMYKNRMMVRTPEDLFFNLYKVKGMWYIDPTFKFVRTVDKNESANHSDKH